jgi:hypothetical protein
MGAPLLGMSFLRKFKKYEFYRDRLILTLWMMLKWYLSFNLQKIVVINAK